MFLEITKQKNPTLLEAGVFLHQNGLISPNTYVIDIDAVRHNTEILVKEAQKQQIDLLFMTKQIGRNPLLAKAIKEAGIEKAVAVDPWETLKLAEHGIQIGHAGHLVQIPLSMMDEIIDLQPDKLTVFSYENAEAISNAATKKGRKQSISLRVVAPNDYIYPGQEGGFLLEDIEKEVTRIEKLPGVSIAGVTSFPCLLVQDGNVQPTPNFTTINKAAAFLREKGYLSVEVNAPSVTTAKTLEIIKKNGGTQGEPGHALTGTTPLHVDETHPELPAMIYVSEISHHYQNQSYIFGGGFYPRSHVEHALVGSDYNQMIKTNIIPTNPENIDYYRTLELSNTSVGDTALFSFRTQIFVTNAQVAVVKNVQTNPEILGIFDSYGNQL